MKCPKCGAPIQDNLDFCTSCGYRVREKINTTDAKRPSDMPTKSKKSINWWLVGAVLMLIICGISLYYCIITGIQLRGTGGISGSFCESLQRGISANTYQLPEEEDVLYYYDDHGNLQVISVKPGTCGVACGRMSFFENGKLSLDCYELTDVYCLYFSDDQLFYWSYYPNKGDSSSYTGKHRLLSDEALFLDMESRVSREAYSYLQLQ